MKRVLCVWEMGAALGHLANLNLFVNEALMRGYHVSLAVRELNNVATLVDLNSVVLYQTPLLRKPQTRYSTPMVCFSQLIMRQVFSNEAGLSVLYKAWQDLFAAVSPDLVVYDHAPSALVASLSERWTKWVIGSGFLVPRVKDSIFGGFPETPLSPENYHLMKQSQIELLALINAVLEDNKASPIQGVNELYQQCDEQLLLTLPELDHFGVRPEGRYLGIQCSNTGIEPKWPSVHPSFRAEEGKGRLKAFVYISYFSGVSRLLDCLLEQQVELLIYARDFPEHLISDYRERIEFVNVPVNLGKVLKSVNFFVSHGNHGSVVQAYICGVPQLMLPKHQEQLFLAWRVQAQKAGVAEFCDQSDFSDAVESVIRLSREPRRPREFDQRRLPRELERCFDAL